MKLQPASKKELRHIAIGVIVGCVIMDLVFLLIGKFNSGVLFGTLLGAFFTILNFYFMCICIQKAVNKEERAKAYMQSMYTLRMLMMLAVMIIGFKVPCFNGIASAIPFLMPRITILVMQLLGIYKPDKSKKSEKKEA